MNVLVIADSYQMPDRASGDLRCFTLLTLMAKKHRLVYCALNANGSVQQPNQYAELLQQHGITLGDFDLPHVLKQFKPDLVWFEFHHQARADYCKLLQRYCPKAKIMIDSVDIHFNRMEARARLTNDPKDQAAAHKMKERELAAYVRGDLVIVVSDDDRLILTKHLPSVPVAVIPNIHSVPEFPDPLNRTYGELVFVGNFTHDPNVDAILYFCRDVMPRIVASHPEAHLNIIGNEPPDDILKLQSHCVNVLGYVPDTKPFLDKAFISIAPLRYGGGMKGKVGEAMSYGLPVVTTSFGAEGFGLVANRDLLIGDDAISFANQVCALLDNSELYNRISKNGYDFIKRNYSLPAVEQILDSTLEHLDSLPPRKIRLSHRLTTSFRYLYERHLAWRLPN